ADGANVVLGDLQTGALTGPPLSGHSAPVIALTLSRDSRVLASADATGTVMLWDVPGRRALQPPLMSGEPGQGSPVSLALSSNGQLLAWGSGTSGAQGEGEGTVQLWQTADATPLGPPLTGLRARPMLAFSPDDIALAASACREFARYGAGCTLGEVRVWDLPQRQLRGEPLLTPASSVTSLAFGPTSGTLATGGGDGTVALWHLDATPPLATRIAEHVPVIAAARGTLAVRDGDLVRISDAVTGTSRGTLGDGSGGPYHWPLGGSAAISANAAWVALSACDAGGRPGCQQGEIRVWNLRDPLQPGPVLVDEHGLASALAFSPDGALLATWSGARVSLWDAVGRRQLGIVPGTTSSGTGSLAFSPDNRVLAVGDGSTVKLWEVASLQSLGTLGLSNALNPAGVFEAVGSLEFSPDGNRLVVGGVPINGTAGSLVLWDIASQQPLARANAAQDGGIHALAISPDGHNLVSAADSDSLALWDAANLQPVGLLVPDSRNPSGASVAAAISLSADGRFVTHTGDALLLWDLDPSAWRARACRRANRTLTESEWRQYVGDPPVASACASS
ncbi:MAG TPA: WD40 repeat domain-containing protein, partial [Chloroflexota bacterium]